MKRFAYIDKSKKQLIFGEDKTTIDVLKNNFPGLMFVTQRKDEELTVKAIEKKYGITLKWQKIEAEDMFGRKIKWYGYVLQEENNQS